MQQATTAKPQNEPAPDRATRHSALRNRFVINLCGSTTPVSLTPPDHAGLKRFTFFVSRRREEGRERFRLHMGYFASQEEAERLLDIVREIYPGAWAGLAPGQRLAQAEAEAVAAALANAAASDQASPSAAAQPTSAAPPPPVPAPPVVAEPAEAAAKPVAPQSAPLEVTSGVIDASPVAPVAHGAAEVPALSLVPDDEPRVEKTPRANHEDDDAATRALSNVRAAIASLGDTNASVRTLSPLPELKPVVRAPAAAKAVVAVASAGASALSDSAALRVLENRDGNASTGVNRPHAPAADASPTGRNEKPAFAVQLLWSVQPIDITHIPQLAIFSAYTLYGAEGNRDGRRWYGVRLGFFTDAVSAKQVAHYVRSDFSTVSVVPVTARERERAKLAAARPDATPVSAAPPAPAAPPAAAASAVNKPAASSFEFIEDKQPLQVRTAAAGATQAASSPRGAPGKRARSRASRQTNGRSKSKPMTLEETLEILGAGELKVDDARRASVNDGLAKIPTDAGAKDKSSRFGRLLERLSGLGS
jgi:hypothetical protein